MDSQTDNQKPSSKEIEQVPDKINHPDHYTQGGIECIDAIKAALGPEFGDYCIGNVIKYVWRCRYKGGIEDLRKSAVYLQWAIEAAEALDIEQPEPQPTQHATPQVSPHVNPKDFAAEVAKHLWNQPVTTYSDWVNKAVASVSPVIESVAPNIPETPKSPFAVGDEVEVTLPGHRYFGKRYKVSEVADRTCVIECRDGLRQAIVGVQNLRKVEPNASQYRDVTEADVGMEIEVRDFEDGPWQEYTLLSFIHPSSEAGRSGYRYETDGYLNWKYARIKIGGEA